MSTLLATRPGDGPSLLIRVLPGTRATGVPEEAYRDLVDELRAHQLVNGLVITPTETVVLEHRGWHGTERRYERSEPIDTARLFAAAQVGEPSETRLGRQVEDWILAVQRNWIAALPPEAGPAMVPGVVGSLSGSQVSVL